MFKSETGQFQLSNSSIDLTSLLEGVACTLAGRAVSRGLEVIAFTGASVPAWIQADGRALRRILLSLGKFTLENAGGVAFSGSPDREGQSATGSASRP